ncbi:TPA: hypothetical protein N0F65_001904 [Lagenidium giganteum]|uniref:Uncharacterized protein n=1 Tax=Lagenidium giganteum TaxID=4803 RepID=A0AAV2YX85_9STRA|nr:TPA: hypothetical protein N0F65_001904 [Lagenidium giganteum]
MDMSIDDCEARVFAYFRCFNHIVESHGLQGVLGQYKDRMKLRCSLLVENLRPAVLCMQIERLLAYERRDCRTNDVD